MKVFGALVVPKGTFPKAREAGVIVMGFVPVPVRVMVCEPASTLSLTVMVPVDVPVAVGVKVMEIEHLAPAASEKVPVQLPLSAKAPVAGPTVTDTVLAPVFLTFTVLAALVLPTATEPKERDVVLRVTIWACAAAASSQKNIMTAMRVEIDEGRNQGFIRTSLLNEDALGNQPLCG